MSKYTVGPAMSVGERASGMAANQEVEKMKARIAELEAEVLRLRNAVKAWEEAAPCGRRGFNIGTEVGCDECELVLWEGTCPRKNHPSG